ncbi:MAG: methyl-accepting chemotaxis protein, partial [Marinobacter excellens HL-55]
MLDMFKHNRSSQQTLLAATGRWLNSKLDDDQADLEQPDFSNLPEELKQALLKVEMFRAKSEENARLAEQRLDESRRINSAMECMSSNVMIADEDHNIVYTNPAVVKFLTDAEADIKVSLPNFKASDLLTSSIDRYHKDPSVQRKMLAALESTYTANIKLGDRHFRLMVNPVKGEGGRKLGHVVEWLDRTAEEFAITQMQDVVQAVQEGDLTRRITTTANSDGLTRIVGENFNQVLELILDPLTVASTYVKRIAAGDIPEPITDEYKGDFNEIKNNLNTCISAVNKMINDADLLSQAAVRGELDTRADASKHEGDFRRIVQGVNDTLDAVIGPLNVAADYVDRISRGE